MILDPKIIFDKFVRIGLKTPIPNFSLIGESRLCDRSRAVW